MTPPSNWCQHLLTQKVPGLFLIALFLMILGFEHALASSTYNPTSSTAPASPASNTPAAKPPEAGKTDFQYYEGSQYTEAHQNFVKHATKFTIASCKHKGSNLRIVQKDLDREAHKMTSGGRKRRFKSASVELKKIDQQCHGKITVSTDGNSEEISF